MAQFSKMRAGAFSILSTAIFPMFRLFLIHNWHSNKALYGMSCDVRLKCEVL